MKYRASLDTLSRVITICCCFIIGVLIIINIRSLIKVPIGSSSFFLFLFVIILLLTIPVVCYLLSPKVYRVNNNTLYISSKLKTLAIHVADIAKVELLTKADAKGMIRTFSVGGLFGYFGRFYTRALGTVYLYTTQRSNRILITTKKGMKVIISPDDVQLLHLFNKNISYIIRQSDQVEKEL